MADATAIQHPRRGRHARSARAGAASALLVPASAIGQPAEPDHASRPMTDLANWRDTLAPPEVSGGPPWGPAPKPAGQGSS
jgi:hypothetical protein